MPDDLEANQVIDEVLAIALERGGQSDHRVEAVVEWVDAHPDASSRSLAVLGSFLLRDWHIDPTPEGRAGRGL